MFKNDTMVQYVTDRHPHLAPLTVWDRIDWSAAAVMQEARVQAMVDLHRPAAPVFNIAEARIARALAADPVLMGGWGPAPKAKTDREYAEMAWGPLPDSPA